MPISDLKSHVSGLASVFADIIAPRVCAGCEREGSWFCASCIAAVAWDANLVCIGCNRFARFGTTCDQCRRTFSLDGVLAATSFDAPAMRRLIHLVKYAPARDAAGAFSFLVDAWYAQGGSVACAETVGAASVVVPIPLHRRRERERGFNQSAVIARAIAARFGTRVLPALRRARTTPPQAELDRAARLTNVTGAFACTDVAAVRGRSVLLIDDVVTTGATMSECARTLRAAGAARIWGFALARG